MYPPTDGGKVSRIYNLEGRGLEARTSKMGAFLVNKRESQWRSWLSSWYEGAGICFLEKPPKG
jgi:hypothetical protein